MTSIQDYQAREHLLNALKERGIALGSDDISWAFASPKTREEVINWVKEYLHDDTLLSQHEIDLYEALVSKQGNQGPRGSGRSGDVVVHDRQLKAAIESLQASTSMIEKHAISLEQQRDALQSLRQKNDKGRHRASTGPSPYAPRFHGNGSAVDVPLDELLQNLQEDFHASSNQSSRAARELRGLVQERLGADDEVLAALAKLAPKTIKGEDNSVDMATVDQWSHALIALREQEAKAKVDTSINEHVLELMRSGAATSAQGDPQSEAEMAAELETLKQEIGSVVELIVGSEVRQPLLKLMERRANQIGQSQGEWLRYVLDTLEHMINQLDLIGAYAGDISSYDQAVHEIRTLILAVVSPEQENESGSRPPTATARPGRPQRADSRAVINNVTLVEQAFRRFGISGTPSSSTLSRASEASLGRLHSQYVSAAASTTEVVGRSLHEQRVELQTLLKQLYAFTDYATVSLAPGDLEAWVQGLDDAIGATVAVLGSAERNNHEDVRRGIAKVKERLLDV